jgi:RNA polymerase sigma-70 factor (ECF subfamily)
MVAALVQIKLAELPTLAELYRLHAPRVLSLAAWLLPSRDAAEDAVSDIFLRLPEKPQRMTGRVPLEAWLVRVTTNWCIDWLRRNSRERSLFEPWTHRPNLPAPIRPSTICLVRERAETLRAAVRALPPRYRVPLVLRYFCDLSYDEVAARIGLDRAQTGGAAISWQARASPPIEGKIPMTCPSESRTCSLRNGALAIEPAQHIEAHIRACEACRRTVALLRRRKCRPRCRPRR